MALVSKTFSQIITFTRASTATYFDSAGVLQSAAIDAPRLDYNPSTLAAQGLLIEESRTNLCLQSADFFEAGTGGVNWIWPPGLITGNTQVSPDGTTTADTVTSAGGVASIYQNITVTASTSYTFSLFVKLGTMSASDYKIAIYNNTAANFIATDVVPSQTPNTSSWTRITYTFTTPVGCVSVRVYPFRNSATITSSTVFIWGAQFEAGAFPTSYIPTTTTALTRAADVASVNTLSPWYNATTGTIYAEFLRNTTPAASTFPQMVNIHDGTTNNRLALLTNSARNLRGQVAIGGVFTTIATANAYSEGIVSKLALGYEALNYATVANGGTPATNTAVGVPSGLTAMRLGDQADGFGPLNGWLRRVTVYPRRLSNAELQAITA